MNISPFWADGFSKKFPNIEYYFFREIILYIIYFELYSLPDKGNDSHQCPILAADFVIFYYGTENEEAIQAGGEVSEG